MFLLSCLRCVGNQLRSESAIGSALQPLYNQVPASACPLTPGNPPSPAPKPPIRLSCSLREAHQTILSIASHLTATQPPVRIDMNRRPARPRPRIRQMLAPGRTRSNEAIQHGLYIRHLSLDPPRQLVHSSRTIRAELEIVPMSVAPTVDRGGRRRGREREAVRQIEDALAVQHSADVSVG